MTVEDRSWQELCEAASKEPESGQLMVLISQLMKAWTNIRSLPKRAVSGKRPVLFPNIRELRATCGKHRCAWARKIER